MKLPLWVKAIVLAGVLFLLWGLKQAYDGGLRAEGAAAERALWVERDRQDAEAGARETFRRLARQKENDDAQAAQLARLDADLRESRRVAGGLRHDLQRFVAAAATRRGGDPAPSGGSSIQPGADALDVLAHLFSRADDAAGELAEYADRLRIAGARCEADYNALMGAAR
ncbi:MAG TPA: DUF2514 family protein [Aquabacterium sp.]|nr:DUF2514 family protein [Aquabacterium sp.]